MLSIIRGVHIKPLYLWIAASELGSHNITYFLYVARNTEGIIHILYWCISFYLWLCIIFVTAKLEKLTPQEHAQCIVWFIDTRPDLHMQCNFWMKYQGHHQADHWCMGGVSILWRLEVSFSRQYPGIRAQMMGCGTDLRIICV